MRIIGFPGQTEEQLGRTVATIGVFDGVHTGHRLLLSEVVKSARRQKAKAVVITFDPHPQAVLGMVDNPVKLLSSLPERLAEFETIGIDVAIVCRFTRELSLLTAEQFLVELMSRFGIREFILGPNHTFGYKRSGNRDTLPAIAKALDISIGWIEPNLIEGRTVSSSWIRSLLYEGELEQANNLLGSPYHLSGIVVAGDQRGRQLGFPTANIQIESTEKLIPCDGVYFAQTVDETGVVRPTLLSIGTRPTFGALPRAIEAFILDFNGDLYGRKIHLNLLKFCRPQLTFTSAEELIGKMNDDLAQARVYFQKVSK